MENANIHFKEYFGTENLYRYSFTHFVYTDGVKAMAEKCHSFWLIDLIISHQCHQKVRIQPFQVWDLKRVKDDSFIAIATDGNKNQITSQEIPFSDFPYDLATLWMVDGCIMLPSEY